MAENGVIGQNPRLFTVGICSTASKQKVVGTGFIVSPSGIIATCRHVIRDAGMNPDTGCVMLTLRQLMGINRRREAIKAKKAKVVVYIPAAYEYGVHRKGRLYSAVFKPSRPYPFSDDVQGKRGFSLANAGTHPSTLEPFWIDERKVNLDVLVLGVVRRLHAEKWIGRN